MSSVRILIQVASTLNKLFNFNKLYNHTKTDLYNLDNWKVTFVALFPQVGKMKKNIYIYT